MKYNTIFHRERRNMQEKITEREEQIPVYARTEVLVVGGGPAGFTAAVSAARQGADVILMERYGYLGGMSTGGYVLLVDCICDGKGNLVIRGLVEEMLERLRKIHGLIEPGETERGSSELKDILKWRRYGATGGEDKIVRWSPVIDPEMMKCVCNDMAEKAGVKLLFHAWFSKAYVEDQSVKGVIFESKSGRQAVLADVVIDCTGDGDVFADAGEEYEIGKLPLGLVFRVANVDCDKAEKFLAQPHAAEAVSADLKKIGGIRGGYSFGELPQGFYMRSSIPNVVWFNNTIGGSAINIDDLANAEINIRKAMLITEDYFKSNVPGFEESVIIDTAPQVGTRCSRMLKGEYSITRKELMAGSQYPDSVVAAQPPYRGFETNHALKEIPYRCFVPRINDGLLVAGRCLSGDFGAVEMLRVVPTSMLMGQACGTAAAIAVKNKIQPREVNPKWIQDALEKQNVLVMRHTN
jgi:hypothetical protein